VTSVLDNNDRTNARWGPLSTGPRLRRGSGVALAVAVAAALVVVQQGDARAAVTAVTLGTADSFAVLAGTGVTNTDTAVTTIHGDIGTHPTPTYTPGALGITQTGGTVHLADAVALQAKADLDAAYGVAAGQSPSTTVPTELGSTTKLPGVYSSLDGTFGITGPLVLDAGGDPAAQFVFQTSTTLTTASASSITLINEAQACNVFWQVGSSATLGTASQFAGTILADASITVTTGTTIVGRALARTGAVTLDGNTITRPACAPVTPPGDTSGDTVPTATPPAGPRSTGTSERPGSGQVSRVPLGSVDAGDGSADIAPLQRRTH
jgi:hypothetical protein